MSELKDLENGILSSPLSAVHPVHRPEADHDIAEHDEPAVPVGGIASEKSISTEQEEQADQDPNIVDWDGPDDPENPMNWPTWRKVLAIGIVSAITFIT